MKLVVNDGVAQSQKFTGRTGDEKRVFSWYDLVEFHVLVSLPLTHEST